MGLYPGTEQSTGRAMSRWKERQKNLAERQQELTPEIGPTAAEYIAYFAALPRPDNTDEERP